MLRAELVGTFLLVFFGTGSVAAAVLTGAQMGLWQVAVVWGFGVTIAIYATAAASGAHLNPAVTLAFALRRPQLFRPGLVLRYWLAQLLGAMLASATIAAVFNGVLARFESAKGLVRGQPGSQLSAMVFGEYFPNPAIFGTDDAAQALVSPLTATLVECLGTAVLVFVIFALTDTHNAGTPTAGLAPFFIGFTVAILISVFAPLTQAGWNPARDLGPRIVAFALGWGPIAIPGPRWEVLVYVVGPLVGGPLGAWLYDWLLRPGLQPVPPVGEERS
ncbi:MAG: aquaporin family protein [Chloroflexi bacterium]|nr:aquaporin family protein [Chloroflexota bacterium]